MKLGPFEVEHPFVLAPMAGITNSPYRRLMRKMGSSLVVSELVSATGIEYLSKRTLELLRFKDDERLVGLQIFGEDEHHLIKACQHIEKLGADFVDLNLGCPVPKVVSKGAGSAMCRDPKRLGEILSSMVKSVRIPVTIKIRTGWDQSSRNALDVVNAAQDAGVSWVVIHGRTRAQGYSGEADWDFIGNIKAKSTLPIIGNGDISTAELAVRRLKETGVDAVWIGRGALRNPFLFQQSKELWSDGRYNDVNFERFLAFLVEQKEIFEGDYDEKGALLFARKFLAWYAAGFPGCHEFRKRVFTVPTSQELWDLAFDFFRIAYHQRDSKFLSEPFLMGGHG